MPLCIIFSLQAERVLLKICLAEVPLSKVTNSNQLFLWVGWSMTSDLMETKDSLQTCNIIDIVHYRGDVKVIRGGVLPFFNAGHVRVLRGGKAAHVIVRRSVFLCGENKPLWYRN